MTQIKKLKIKLDDKDKITELLQEIYNEACKNIEEAQREINKISMSTNLNEELLDGKAKYAKSINDFITTKDKAIGRKLDIAKLLTEIVKYNGNIQQAYNETSVPDDWGIITNNIDKINTQPTENKKIEYKMK
jgi:hypothetical protein